MALLKYSVFLFKGRAQSLQRRKKRRWWCASRLHGLFLPAKWGRKLILQKRLLTWEHRDTVAVVKLRARHLRSFELYELTGLNGSQFGVLVSRLWALHPDTGRGRPWNLLFPDGRIIRDIAWRRFRNRRATVEHVLAELKVWSVLRDCRWRGDGIDQSVRAVTALHNLRIEMKNTN